ncbi:hypothetical protein ORI89_02780 [Sphingobacterium sp. UT-1RO-CII-1]|uniref:hypothetical protein n=1 Tax=Sphingobacterium sp. UT-1RO-CII-1 TaxID=2995225 RepID=UPI00227B718D|nr:hypothetical protein [Sphingobacterium sp. UT-1RO-CII-1]MCY4778560.1 hypothetical protein [Sphingobacterium sp. UT-1RO-CII-1]
MAWFELTGSSPIAPSNYTLRTSPPSCGGQDQICAIQANADTSSKPQLTEALKDEMITALHDGVESTNVKLRDR